MNNAQQLILSSFFAFISSTIPIKSASEHYDRKYQDRIHPLAYSRANFFLERHVKSSHLLTLILKKSF